MHRTTPLCVTIEERKMNYDTWSVVLHFLSLRARHAAKRVSKMLSAACDVASAEQLGWLEESIKYRMPPHLPGWKTVVLGVAEGGVTWRFGKIAWLALDCCNRAIESNEHMQQVAQVAKNLSEDKIKKALARCIGWPTQPELAAAVTMKEPLPWEKAGWELYTFRQAEEITYVVHSLLDFGDVMIESMHTMVQMLSGIRVFTLSNCLMRGKGIHYPSVA